MTASVLTRILPALLLTTIVLACAYSPNSNDSGERENPAAAKAIQNYLSDFGMPGMETSWYKNIVGVSVRGDTVYVSSSLSSAARRASDICAAVSMFVFDNQNRSYGLANVQVLGQNGQILVNRRGVSGRCD